MSDKPVPGVKKEGIPPFTRHSARRTVTVTVLLILLLFLLFMYIVYAIRLLEPPAFLRPLFGYDRDEVVEVLPGDNGEIYASLKGEADAGFFIQYNIGALDAATLLADVTPHTTYYIRNTVSYFSGDQSAVTINHLYRNDEKWRVESYNENDELVKLTVCDGRRVMVTDYTVSPGGSARIFDGVGSFTPESAAGMPITDTVQVAATGQDVTYQLRETALVRSLYGVVYFISYHHTTAMHDETVYLSMEFGLPVYAEISRDGSPVYTLSTQLIQADYDPSDNTLYSIPQ